MKCDKLKVYHGREIYDDIEYYTIKSKRKNK